MNLFHAFLLGIIQGLTEFIPVSSTAHLLITQQLLNIPASDAMFSFLVIVQLGTIVSLFAFYWKDLLNIITATFQALPTLFKPATRNLQLANRDQQLATRGPQPAATRNLKPEALLGFYIIIATIPALLAGYLLKDAVETLFRQPMLEASIRLFTAAVLLSLAEWFSKKNRDLNSMTWLDALIVGLMQVIAVFPGASRSGTTIAGGMFRGFDRPSAARFAFLMSVPVMLAAGGYEMLDVIKMPNLAQFLPLLAVGFVTAAVTGWFAIKWLINYLSKNSLYIFAAYCAVIGFILLIVQAF
jgi:undecaprenyl-diphosphatase